MKPYEAQSFSIHFPDVSVHPHTVLLPALKSATNCPPLAKCVVDSTIEINKVEWGALSKFN